MSELQPPLWGRAAIQAPKSRLDTRNLGAYLILPLATGHGTSTEGPEPPLWGHPALRNHPALGKTNKNPAQIDVLHARRHRVLAPRPQH